MVTLLLIACNTTKTKRIRSLSKGKIFVELYNKICEAVSLLGDLMDIERLTDTIVLQVIHRSLQRYFLHLSNICEMCIEKKY